MKFQNTMNLVFPLKGANQTLNKGFALKIIWIFLHTTLDQLYCEVLLGRNFS
jgi:hypothetical protein